MFVPLEFCRKVQLIFKVFWEFCLELLNVLNHCLELTQEKHLLLIWTRIKKLTCLIENKVKQPDQYVNELALISVFGKSHIEYTFNSGKLPSINFSLSTMTDISQNRVFQLINSDFKRFHIFREEYFGPLSILESDFVDNSHLGNVLNNRQRFLLPNNLMIEM